MSATAKTGATTKRFLVESGDLHEIVRAKDYDDAVRKAIRKVVRNAKKDGHSLPSLGEIMMCIECRGEELYFHTPSILKEIGMWAGGDND